MRETRVNGRGEPDPNGVYLIPTPCTVCGGHDCDCPRCDKCGAEITTGLMAVFCAGKRDCEFWCQELDEFMRDMTPNDQAQPRRATRSVVRECAPKACTSAGAQG